MRAVFQILADRVLCGGIYLCHDDLASVKFVNTGNSNKKSPVAALRVDFKRGQLSIEYRFDAVTVAHFTHTRKGYTGAAIVTVR